MCTPSLIFLTPWHIMGLFPPALIWFAVMISWVSPLSKWSLSNRGHQSLLHSMLSILLSSQEFNFPSLKTSTMKANAFHLIVSNFLVSTLLSSCLSHFLVQNSSLSSKGCGREDTDELYTESPTALRHKPRLCETCIPPLPAIWNHCRSLSSFQ